MRGLCRVQDADVIEPDFRLLLFSISDRWALLKGSKLPVQGTNLRIMLWPLCLRVVVLPKKVGRRIEPGLVT